MRIDREGQGFTLVELMLAAALGMLLFGVALSLLVGDADHSRAMAAAIQIRRLQRRTLRLIQHDLATASGWIVNPQSTTPGSCGLSQRTPLLAITPGDGSPALLYSIGNAPSAIWRSPVLMRCGPAFDLDGRPSAGAYQNRVVLDGVDHAGMADHPNLPVLLLELERQRGDQRIRSEAVG